ncbi:gp436 family protein [Vallitalea guaymasensis]|uniref:gp436 family protein n=1 Tax=Vallitalea guaymasensis TaxID=1185412 RepID=UPI000DE306B0|nr:DUF1320 domain-containing protein [Vallitalea guaymasensis]
MYVTVDEIKAVIKNESFDALVDVDLEESQRETKINDIINTAIQDADGTINGYLGTRYPVPLPLPPDKLINNLSKDIAVYNIFSRIGIDEDSRENTIITRYKNAVKFLEKVAEGKINLPIGREKRKPVDKLRIHSSRRIFSRDSMRGM